MNVVNAVELQFEAKEIAEDIVEKVFAGYIFGVICDPSKDKDAIIKDWISEAAYILRMEIVKNKYTICEINPIMGELNNIFGSMYF